MKTIYLDYNATTPCDPRVIESMRPYWTEKFGNSIALTSPYGWEAEEALESSRRKIAGLLKARPHEFTFTSGATEANNWAIRGLVEQIRIDEGASAKIHILSSPVEHASVLRTLDQVEKIYGVEVEYLAVNKSGQIDTSDLKRKLRPETRLVCAIWVNNEIGSVNPLSDIVALCKENKTLVLADGTQALGKIEVDLTQVQADLVSFSSHKLYGPKGCGFLFHRGKDPLVRLQPLFCGGGHERGLRSGSVNVSGIVGMARAIEIAFEDFQAERDRLTLLRNSMWDRLQLVAPGIRLNGAPWEQRSSVNLNVTLPVSSESINLPGLAVSQSSACSSGKSAASHVLTAIGLNESEARSTLRITLGRWTTAEEITQAIGIIEKYIQAQKPEMTIR